MASKYQIIAEAAAREATEIISGTDKYLAFLRTAANNYKYSFQEQLLIHYQRPEATACAEMQLWNRLGRWVNRGSTGIALLVESSARFRLRYVFDVSDTSDTSGREFRLWNLEPQFVSSVASTLIDTFGVEETPIDFPDVIRQVINSATDISLGGYADQLNSVSEGSRLADIDDNSKAARLAETVKASAAYMALFRCGYDPLAAINEDEFLGAMDFNSTETVSVLGSAMSFIASSVLRQIEAAVKNLEIEERLTSRTFAEKEHADYNDSRTNNSGRSNDHGDDLHETGRLLPAESDRPREPEDWQIWNAAAQLPAEPPERSVHRDAADGQTEHASGGDRPSSNRADGAADGTDGERSGRDGASEGIESDALGTEDDEHPELGGGDRNDGVGVQLTPALPSEEEQKEIIAEAEAENASAFAISQEEIDAILLRGGNVQHGKFRIYEQYLLKQSKAENITFLKNEYGVGGSYPAANGVGRILDEDHDSKGIRVRTGFHEEPKVEVLLSWKKVEKRIGELIDADRYLSPKEKEAYPAYRKEQEDRVSRNAIAEEFRSVVRDYNDF